MDQGGREVRVTAWDVAARTSRSFQVESEHNSVAEVKS